MNIVTFIENLELELKTLSKDDLIEIIIQLAIELPRSERNILIDKISQLHESDNGLEVPLDFELPIDRKPTPKKNPPVKQKRFFFIKRPKPTVNGNQLKPSEIQKQIEKLQESESIWNRNVRKK